MCHMFDTFIKLTVEQHVFQIFTTLIKQVEMYTTPKYQIINEEYEYE